MMKIDKTPRQHIVLDAFQTLTAKLESIMLQIKEGKYGISFLQEQIECVVIDSVYLVGILLTKTSIEDDLNDIYRVFYTFIRLGPRMRNSFTPLHMCCSNAQYIKNDIVKFPNASLCKTFIACGSNVNDMDNETNTPLHTIVRCVDTVTDFDTLYEILNCLIENGAHIDIRNKESKTAADIANKDFVRSILMAKQEFSLKCLAAAAVRKHDVDYKGDVSKDLQAFIEFH